MRSQNLKAERTHQVRAGRLSVYRIHGSSLVQALLSKPRNRAADGNPRLTCAPTKPHALDYFPRGVNVLRAAGPRFGPRISIRGSVARLDVAVCVFLPTVRVYVARHRFALLPRVRHCIVHTMRIPKGDGTAMPRPPAPFAKLIVESPANSCFELLQEFGGTRGSGNDNVNMVAAHVRSVKDPTSKGAGVANCLKGNRAGSCV